MHVDFRLSVNLIDHPKLEALSEALGSQDAALACLVRLWAFVARHRQDGDLADLPVSTIERRAGWTGEPGQLVRALLEVPAGYSAGFLEVDQDGHLRCHGWTEHNWYAAESRERDAAARENGRRGGIKSGEIRRSKPPLKPPLKLGVEPPTFPSLPTDPPSGGEGVGCIQGGSAGGNGAASPLRGSPSPPLPSGAASGPDEGKPEPARRLKPRRAPNPAVDVEAERRRQLAAIAPAVKAQLEAEAIAEAEAEPSATATEEPAP